MWLWLYPKVSVADSDQSDPDLFGRIRILALRNDPILTFLVSVKAIDIFRNLCCLTFWIMNILFRAYSNQQNFQKKLAKNCCKSESGSGFGCFRKSDQDPVKNLPDPQHCLEFYRYRPSQVKSGILTAINRKLMIFSISAVFFLI
jgi:hypothetical protein